MGGGPTHKVMLDFDGTSCVNALQCQGTTMAEHEPWQLIAPALQAVRRCQPDQRGQHLAFDQTTRGAVDRLPEPRARLQRQSQTSLLSLVSMIGLGGLSPDLARCSIAMPVGQQRHVW